MHTCTQRQYHNTYFFLWFAKQDPPLSLRKLNRSGCLSVRNKKSPTGFSVETYPILHPHRIISFLMDHVQINVCKAEVAEYWQHARRMGEQWAVNHPSPGDHIPLGLHGDSARLWTQCTFEKYTAISFNILHFRPKSVRYSRFVVFSIPTAKLFKNRTLNSVWRRLAWSFF